MKRKMDDGKQLRVSPQDIFNVKKLPKPLQATLQRAKCSNTFKTTLPKLKVQISLEAPFLVALVVVVFFAVNRLAREPPKDDLFSDDLGCKTPFVVLSPLEDFPPADDDDDEEEEGDFAFESSLRIRLFVRRKVSSSYLDSERILRE